MRIEFIRDGFLGKVDFGGGFEDFVEYGNTRRKGIYIRILVIILSVIWIWNFIYIIYKFVNFDYY